MARKKRTSRLSLIGVFIKLIPIFISVLFGLYMTNNQYVVNLLVKIKFNEQVKVIIGYIIVFLSILNILLLLFGRNKK